MANSERRVYGTLDGMRGVAAIAVVVLHAEALLGAIRAPNGGLAVDLFFVMSGFIIAHAYEAKMKASLGVGRFMVLRLIRLYPLYLVGLILGLVEALAELHFGRTQAWSSGQILVSAVAGLLMLPAPPGIMDGAAPAFRLNPPAWSLFFEMTINLLYAMSVTRLSNRVLGWIVALSAGAMVATALYVGDLNVGSYWNTLWGGLPRVMFSFSAGVLIYRLRDRLRGVGASPLLVLAFAAMIFTVDAGRWAGLYALVCTLFVLPLLVVLGAATEPGPRLRPIFQFLGVTSYAIYSLHFPIAVAAQGVVRRISGDNPSIFTPWAGLLLIGLLLVACLVIDTVYDAPVRKRLNSWVGSFRLTSAPVRENADRQRAE